jgi:hypothetical protein
MTPNDIASFHADRPGFELLDYAEVGLPVYRLSLTVSVLQHTPLPPIYEFVLRAIRLGIDHREELSACLGISEGMIEDALRNLHGSEEISMVQGLDGPERFVLTRRGEKTTSTLERVRPEQQTIPIFFDGLTREPIDPPAMALLSGRQAEDLGLQEIPALPATRIEVTDIDLSMAARVLARERAGEGRRDLLSIRSIERRTRLHMPAVALVFKEVDGDDIELMFASERQMLDEHNRAFALAEGPKKTRLLAEFAKTEVMGSDSFSRRLSSLSKAADPVKPQVRKRTLAAKPIAAEGTITPVAVHEHQPLLLDAIANAQERVLIICPWITPEVVDGHTLAAFRKLLDAGRHLYIGYGIEEGRPPKAVPPALTSMAAEYERFHLRHFGDTHEKVLIKDAEFAVLGSFNWLSFRGDPTRKLRRERSWKVTDPEFVEKEFATLEARFRQKPRKAAASDEEV